MEKILGMIGLAKRAGAVSCGEMLCSESIKKRKARLVIIAEDTSDNSKKSIINSCTYYKTPYIIFSTKELLGRYTGGSVRSVISINDNNFAKSINSRITESHERIGD